MQHNTKETHHPQADALQQILQFVHLQTQECLLDCEVQKICLIIDDKM